jgi:6-hydroxynicotinate 3-monooxygenase
MGVSQETIRAQASIRGPVGVKVREILLGAETPIFTGRVAHRTVFPTALMGGFALDTCTKWWGPDRHIVMYPVTAARDETYFVTSVPDPDWDVESWSAEGDMAEVRDAFKGFHDDVQRVLAACPRVHKWALFERDPLPRWSRGPVVLLGDACHPMMPYMARKAAPARWRMPASWCAASTPWVTCRRHSKAMRQ